MKWLIIGISGVSGGGKTTLATRLNRHFNDRLQGKPCTGVRIDQVITIGQDEYFHVRDSPKHTWIKDINFINREILSALDMQRMWTNIEKALRDENQRPLIGDDDSIGILLIEGFLIFNDDRINDLCRLRFHMTLSREVCMERRLIRQSQWKHVNPNPVKYFQEYVWPMYLKYRATVGRSEEIHYLNGESPKEDLFERALEIIEKELELLDRTDCKNGVIDL